MVSKTKKRQSKRLNRNISLNSGDEVTNGEVSQTNRSRENANTQENIPPENDVQIMIENAVAQALRNYGIDASKQAKQTPITQSDAYANKDGDRANNLQALSNGRSLDKSRDDVGTGSSNLIGRPAANHHINYLQLLK